MTALSARKMASSFAWSSLENGGAQIAQIVVFLITARILSPEDIGRASLALVIVQAFQTVVSAAISGYVVSTVPDRCAAATSAAWRLALMLGAAQLLVAIVATGGFVAAGGAPRVGGLFVVPALTNMGLALGIAQQAWLTRALAMRALALRTLVSVLVAGCCGIAMALGGFGAYAIVLQALIQAMIGTALLWWLSPWRPGLRAGAADMRAIVRFTRHLFATGTLNVVVGNSDLVIVGALLGVRAAGIYAVARRALFAANGLISTALYQVSLSIFARLHEQALEVERQFLRIVAGSALITVPLFLAVAGLAVPLVRLCFGAKWAEAAPVMMVLMPAGALQSLGIYNQAFTVARGRPDLQARLALVNALVAIPVLIGMARFGAHFGTIWVAVGFTAATALIFPASVALVVRAGRITAARYVVAVAPGFACGAVVGVAVYMVQARAGPDALTNLAASMAVGVVSYAGAVVLLARARLIDAVRLVFKGGDDPVMPAAPGGPPFSVVIPLYDKRDDIAGTIASVLAQTHRRFELIVVDDGSTDGGDAVVEAMTDPRIRIVRQANQGAAAARNTGWQAACHEHVAFLDGDDRWDSDYLATIARLIADFPGCAAFGTSYRRQRSTALGGMVLDDTQLHASLTRGVVARYFVAATRGEQPFYTSTICVRRDVLAALGGFARGVSHGEDIDLWGRIALDHPIAFDPAPRATYRLDAANRAMRACPPLGWHFRASVRAFRARHPDRAMPAGIDRHIDHIELYHAALNRAFTPGAAIRQALQAVRWRHFPLRKGRIWITTLFAGSRA